jgi:hypothetical protein
MKSVYSQLFAPVDAAFLAVFRMMFGATLLFEAINYGVFLCLDCLYREPEFLFKYHRFEWVGVLPGWGLELVFCVMALSALGVMLGCFYRVSAVLLVLSFAYLFFLDQALYLNHFYLVLLFATILVFLPANRLWSVDALRRPDLRAETVPAWSRWWLVVQLEIVLLYAGLAKLTSDWLQLEPMRLWMNYRSQDAAPIFQWLTQDWGIAVASYGAIALHLLGAPLLLFKRTRLIVFCVYAVFHLTNSLVFNIGIFPWVTVAATLVLFDPGWPRQFLAFLQSRGRALRWSHLAVHPPIPSSMAPVNSPVNSAMKFVVLATIGVWLCVQLAVPLRHYLRPGNVAWNEDGHRFSWRMKLRSKRGTAQFYVKYDDGTVIDVDSTEHLTPKQVTKMACIPDLVWQYAQFIEDEYRQSVADDPAVHVISRCSLNTREPVPLISELVDLTSISRTEPAQNWVLPNTKPLPYHIF